MQLEIIMYLNVKPKTVKFLEKFCEIGQAKLLRTENTNDNNNEFDFIKIKDFCSSKDNKECKISQRLRQKVYYI